MSTPEAMKRKPKTMFKKKKNNIINEQEEIPLLPGWNHKGAIISCRILLYAMSHSKMIIS